MSNKSHRSIHHDPMREIDLLLLEGISEHDDSEKPARRPAREVAWVIVALVCLMALVAHTMFTIEAASSRPDAETVSVGPTFMP